MEFLSNKPLLITDTILRDAHQSQAATRMTIEDMLPALETLDSIGYYSLECWGGATFDACMRFLGEDPWERLRTIRKHVKNTKLQMLFRGQNILGYKHYADDVVDAFCAKSIENGIDIVRIFDALFDIGWEDYLERGGVCVVEWSENVADALPSDAIIVSIARGEKDNERIITVEGGGIA